MDENSSKPAETRSPQVSALEVVAEWVRREGGNTRIPTALAALIDATLVSLRRGDPAPEKDIPSLIEIWRLGQHQQRDMPPPRVRGTEFVQWWAAREGHVRQACQDSGCTWLPRLEVRTGGGRGNPNMLQLDFRPLEPLGTEADETTDRDQATPQGWIRYRIDPVKPALWVRLLVGSRPFPMNSWRGYILIGTAALNFALIGLLWLSLLVVWRADRPISTADLASITLALIISAGLWHLTKPIRQLPSRRVTLANDSFLSLNDFHGQLRTMQDTDTRLSGRVFSLVRHWGNCPICAAEVDIADGERDFPGRLVGRCGNAPTEHVFAFDPVRLVGRPLREQGAADPQ